MTSEQFLNHLQAHAPSFAKVLATNEGRLISRPPLVPPLKCQGIKTKLVSAIQQIADTRDYSRWVEPFCGSCVVALNVQPKKALLCGTNIHIIRLYQSIQNGEITPAIAKTLLTEEGEKHHVPTSPEYPALAASEM